MKKPFISLSVIIVLSLAIWFFFYVKTPDAPLTPSETLLVVGVCAVLVFFAKWIINQIQKNTEKRGGWEINIACLPEAGTFRFP